MPSSAGLRLQCGMGLRRKESQGACGRGGDKMSEVKERNGFLSEDVEFCDGNLSR